jgi:hypothetical protein
MHNEGENGNNMAGSRDFKTKSNEVGIWKLKKWSGNLREEGTPYLWGGEC